MEYVTEERRNWREVLREHEQLRAQVKTLCEDTRRLQTDLLAQGRMLAETQTKREAAEQAAQRWRLLACRARGFVERCLVLSNCRHSAKHQRACEQMRQWLRDFHEEEA